MSCERIKIDYNLLVPVEGCDSILVTYTLVGEGPVTVEVVWDGITTNLDKPIYVFLVNGIEYNLGFGTDNYFPEFPLPLWYVAGNDTGYNYFNAKLVVGGIPVDTECPFGTYTIEEGSIFEAFEVNPVMIPNPDGGQSVIGEAIDIYNDKYVYLFTINNQEFIVLYNGESNPPAAPWIVFSEQANTQWELDSTANCPYGNYSSTTYYESSIIFFDYLIISEIPVDPNNELINCYKLLVWKKQCEFSKCVLKYLRNLQFGIFNCNELEHLKNKRRVLNILNSYDARDILYNTTEYNTITYAEIQALLNY